MWWLDAAESLLGMECIQARPSDMEDMAGLRPFILMGEMEGVFDDF